MLLARAGNWQRTEELVRVVKGLFSCMGSSHLAECGFQRLRSVEQAGGNKNKVLSAKTRWARLIDSKLPSHDHDFEELPWASVSAPRGEHWQDTGALFEPSSCKPHDSLKAVATTARTTPWHSPSPIMAAQQTVDLDLMMRFQYEWGCDWPYGEKLWLCILLEGSLVVKSRLLHSPDTFFFVLGEVGGRAAVCWPAEQLVVEDKTCFRLKATAAEPELKFLYTANLDDIEAMSYEWKSPAHLETLGIDSGLGALAFCKDVGSLLEVKARAAFGQMALTPLRALSQHLGLDCAGMDLFQVIQELINKIIPGLAEADVLEIMHQRLDTPQLFDDLLADDSFKSQLNEGEELQDMNMVEDFAAQHKEKLKGQDAFRHSFRQAAVRVRSKQATASAASSSGRGRGKKPAARKATKPPAITSSISEEGLQLWLPLDGKDRIWKDHFNCRWLWYRQGKPRRSCSWLKWGFEQAAQKLVFCAWEMHRLHGGEPPGFPVPDVPDPE